TEELPFLQLGTLGAYHVEEAIGQGGMGVVLRAYEPALHRHVAIKVLAPALAGNAAARRRFARAARGGAGGLHANEDTVYASRGASTRPADCGPWSCSTSPASPCRTASTARAPSTWRRSSASGCGPPLGWRRRTRRG